MVFVLLLTSRVTFVGSHRSQSSKNPLLLLAYLGALHRGMGV